MDHPALPLTLAILVAAVLLILSDRLRADLVALLVLVALGVSGVLTPQEAFSGFSRSAVITIMAISILAEGLRRTGVTDRMGDLLLRLAGRKESHLVVGTMLAGASLSLLMNNIAAAAILLPTISSAARKAGIHPTRLLMPLAFATLLGGMATLLTTTNIVVSGLLIDQGLRGFGILDFAPVGLPLVAIGVAYMTLWGHRLLPTQPIRERTEGVRPPVEDLVQLYRLGERLFRARVPAGSYLIDKPLSRSTFREIYGLNVVGLERNGRLTLAPSPDFVFREGDVVLLEGNLEEFRRRDRPPYLEILPPREWREEDLESPAVVMVEAVLSPRSGLIGQTLRGVHFREKYGFTVLAIWRAGRPDPDQPLRPAPPVRGRAAPPGPPGAAARPAERTGPDSAGEREGIPARGGEGLAGRGHRRAGAGTGGPSLSGGGGGAAGRGSGHDADRHPDDGPGLRGH
jgi:di/tricarboxylate transporter